MSEYDRLAAEATPRPWNQQPMYTSHRDTAIWGGAGFGERVAECGCPINVGKHPVDIADAALIVALINAAPDIAALWKAFMLGWTECGERGLADCETCVWREAHAAADRLRPIFGEGQS
jgi:hypothetical protein